MFTIPPVVLLVTVFACPLVLSAAGQAPEDELSDDLLRQLLPAWNYTAAASVAGGYRDNVLMSSMGEQGSGFVRGEIEAMAAKVPEGTWDGYVFLNAEELRYTSTEATDLERTIILAAQARWLPTAGWSGTLAARGYHQQQVFDISDTEAVLSTALLRVTGYAVGPTVRCSVFPVWLEVGGQFRQDHYKDQIDGYDEQQGEIRIGYSWGRASEFSLGAAELDRDHDTREQFTLGGRPISGTHLRVKQSDYKAKLTLASSKPGWRVSLTASRLQYRDNGSGYFNYDSDQLELSGSWTRGRYEVRGSVGGGRLVFPQQVVGTGIDPEVRRKTETRAELEFTAEITKAFSLIAAAHHERAGSNDERSRFRINTFYAGWRWNWDNLNRFLIE